jgi:DNA invertase Pin-like site-specific DNA recombinase
MNAPEKVPPQSLDPHKVRPRHRDRLAIVYVRQSTPHQVLENRESAALQYQLRQRAIELGWHPSRVLVIDDDQGRSGQSVEGRPGFHRLMAEVGLDHVGIVFGREMSRLARSNKDWHQLLELCGLFQTLLADQDGVYDPGDFNDRLLLGLKGTMSEAETHILKCRLNQGRLNKARRGELFTLPTVGYIRGETGEYQLEPDEQARSVVRLVFEKFEELGSVPAVHSYLTRHDIRMGVRPFRGPRRGQLVWQRPRRSAIYDMLRHPIYAGAYAYGRHRSDPRRRAAGRSGSGRYLADRSEWTSLIRDRLPAYISWEQYEANLRRLSENDTWKWARESPSRSTTLLNGLLICGRCGRRMHVYYTHRGHKARYVCDRAKIDFGEPPCQSAKAEEVDHLIAGQLLRVLEPAALELSLQATEQVEAERERLHRHWKQRRERAAYEVQRASRQYDAVDPENRLVARSLERQWEEKLAAQQQLEEEYDRFLRDQPRGLTDQDRERIRALAADMPGLWQAPTTTVADRRSIVRQLIERVEMARRGETEWLDVRISWRGGLSSRHEVASGVRRYEQLRDYQALRERIATLRGEGRTSAEIAADLNREGFTRARGRSYTGEVVRRLFIKFGLSSVPAGVRTAEDLPAAEEWWLGDLAGRLEVPRDVLHRWTQKGWVGGRKLQGKQGRWILWADRHELKRLVRLRDFVSLHPGEPIPQNLVTPTRRSEGGQPNERKRKVHATASKTR